MTDNPASQKPWGGRFTESTDAFVETFTASVNFDRRLYRYDIQGSRAHARMLSSSVALNTPTFSSMRAWAREPWIS